MFLMGKFRQILTQKNIISTFNQYKGLIIHRKKNGLNSKKQIPKSPDFKDNKVPVGSQEYRRDSVFFFFFFFGLLQYLVYSQFWLNYFYQ
jgi:hypothetical protein